MSVIQAPAELVAFVHGWTRSGEVSIRQTTAGEWRVSGDVVRKGLLLDFDVTAEPLDTLEARIMEHAARDRTVAVSGQGSGATT